MSYKPLLKAETHQRAEVEELVARAEQPEVVLEGLVISEEITRRKMKLAQLAEAKEGLEARAEERTAAELTEYEEKWRERAKERTTGRRLGGHSPKPPVPGPVMATSTTSLIRSHVS